MCWIMTGPGIMIIAVMKRYHCVMHTCMMCDIH